MSLIDRLIPGRSIQAKLAGAIIVITASCLTFACTTFWLNDLRVTRKNFDRIVSGVMEMISINSIASLYFEDVEAAREILSSLKAGSDLVEGAALYLSDGRRFATYVRPGNMSKDLLFPEHVRTEGKVAENSRGIITREVRFKGATVGYLLFRMDMTGYHRQLAWYSFQALVIAILSVLLGIFISLYLKRQLLGPVSHLVDTVKQISREKKFSIRARGGANDEIGDLINGFNEMIGEIQKRDHELERQRMGLEDQVSTRTRDLTGANRELKRLNLELSCANSAKSDFLSRMSHELRTPLNGIIGYTQLLMKEAGNIGDMEAERLSVILQCGEHLLLIINDILDLSKIEAGKVEIKTTPFDLGPFIRATAEMARSKAGEKGLPVVIDMDEGLSSRVTGDYRRIRQVLLNLLSNAVKFTDRGKIVLGVMPVGDRVRFMVTDTGIGIAEQNLKNIFNAFAQVGSVRRKSEGTGLGLAISRHLVGLMDARLCVESVVGKGSRFWFDIVLPPRGENRHSLGPVQEESPGQSSAFSLPTPPPAPVLAVLKARADMGDIAGIRCWCEENRQAHEAYGAFFALTEKLARAFKINDINRLVSVATGTATEIKLYENHIGGG
ncbi:MAG: HAMP domain-containing protein [Desulfobacteraceae bacterium]|nr:HAMP domain-containing protein [Desulfobacteraceae bacterium]